MEIYAGNLAYELTRDELRAAFEQCGRVDEARIMTDRQTGRSRGFGFVTMPDGEQGRRAISKLSGTELAGRRLVVNVSRGRETRRTQHGRGRR